MMALSELQEELKGKLYAVWDESDFVIGIGSMLKGDAETREMLDYLESMEWASFSDITLKALTINMGRGGDQGTEEPQKR